MIASMSIWKTALVPGLAIANYETIPAANTRLTHFDTLIVLGTPCEADGTPSPEGRERVLEGVREFRAGVASHVVMTGGAAHNQFVEADCMKRLAVATRSWKRTAGDRRRWSVPRRTCRAPR